MKDFAVLIEAIDQTTKLNAKVAALTEYFATANDEDKLWAIAILSGRRPKRTVSAALLREWAGQQAGIAPWLFEESYHVVGDLAETIALTLPPPVMVHDYSLSHYIHLLNALAKTDDAEKMEVVQDCWKGLDYLERFIFNKLVTGGFRIGVSQKLVIRALAKSTGLEENLLAHRLMGDWTPDSTTFSQLLFDDNPGDSLSRPYPFYLAYPLEMAPKELGPVAEWQAEFKWDGIRGQLIKRDGQVFLWSRGEELVTDKFPEIVAAAAALPDGTVLDGEIIGWEQDAPLAFHLLQTRIGRKNLTPAILKKCPVVLLIYDLLEWEGKDCRLLPMEERRTLAETAFAAAGESPALVISPVLEVNSWAELTALRADSRSVLAEGLMLKRKISPYETGRKKGNWWKWKLDPLSIDAVMIYAQRGHGRRANLYTDFTFAVWDGEGQLVPFAKAYSGLTDKEMGQVDAFVKRNTIDKFGPVRSVTPELVFEIGFEGINPSPRHKSGIALRFPRILRWRTDKTAKEANTLSDLQKMLDLYGG